MIACEINAIGQIRSPGVWDLFRHSRDGEGLGEGHKGGTVGVSW